MIEAYPLCWPENRSRTIYHRRESARFDTSFTRARDEVVHQIEMMVGRGSYARERAGVVISTNITLRRDGLPLANQRSPDDPGVAVYFTHNKRQMCFACDRWKNVADNMQAIAKTIDALRGIARWGTGDMMEAAFTGFAALPAPGKSSGRGWREILGLPVDSKPAFSEVERAYKIRRSETHPDKPNGNGEEFNAVQRAWEIAQQEITQ